jgi:hypothetical protein
MILKLINVNSYKLLFDFLLAVKSINSKYTDVKLDLIN